MRCINCGFAENPSGATVCSRCGQPLGGDAYGPQFYNQQHRSSSNASFDQAQKTRRIRPEDLEIMQAPEPVEQASKICPKCHYPILDGYNICPCCGTELRKSVAQESVQADVIEQTFKCEHCGKEVSTAYSFCPACGQKLHLPTLTFNTRRRKGIKAEPLPEYKCSLSVIPYEEEEMEAIRNDYKGPEVVLTRENTEPKNRFISSKGQALLECDEQGKWYITNQSEQNPTVIQVIRKMALEDGDIIILGDRSFRFEVEK